MFANGVEAFVTGGAKEYFVFQFDLVFARGRVRIGNDVWEGLTPAPSPRYSGFEELASVDLSLYVSADDRYPTGMLHDLVRAMETGASPLLSLRSAVDALALGVACVQAGTTDVTVAPGDLARQLRVESI